MEILIYISTILFSFMVVAYVFDLDDKEEDNEESDTTL